jgi:hypothetical protein
MKALIVGAALALPGTAGAADLGLHWANRPAATPGMSTRLNSVALSPDGAIYAAGEVARSFSDTDYVVVRLDPAGRMEWMRTYDDGANSFDSVAGIAVMPSGEVVVAGTVTPQFDPFDQDVLGITYDALGDVVRTYRYSGGEGYLDVAAGVAVDAAGAAYYTGESAGPSTQGMFLAKDAPTGSWTVTTGYRLPKAPFLDNAGFVYVLDEWIPGTNFAIRLAKYSAASGTLAWERPFDFDLIDEAASANVDAFGEVSGWSNVTTGSFEDPLPSLAIGFVKFGPAGQFRGFRIFNFAPPGENERVNASGVDAAGNAYAVGSVAGQFFVIKVNTSNNVVWTRSDFAGEARAIYVSPAGEVTAAGESGGQALIVRYDTTGGLIFERTLDGTLAAWSLAVAPGDRLVVAGETDFTRGVVASLGVCTTTCNDTPGDVNCDGVVSVGDIGAFVTALTDPVGYMSLYPDCFLFNADLNGDEQVSVGDIGPFVELLAG